MNICILGSGNVAHHMSKALYNAGHNILQVYGRNKTTTKAVAKRVKSTAINDINSLDPKADLYLITVSDNAISSVANAIPFVLTNDQIIAHTAGSISSKVLEGISHNYGSFYPLQTFSKTRRLSFSKIPMCICGSGDHTQRHLTQLAKTISRDVRSVDDDTRKTIHLSAVFACNFVNHMIAQAEGILSHAEVDDDILLPLIQETISKVKAKKASNSQTGPARRGDTIVLDSHMAMLADQPDIQELYKDISKSITKKYQ